MTEDHPVQLGTRCPPGRETLAEAWQSAVDASPRRPFLTFEDETEAVTSWSYGQFNQLVVRVAGGLSRRGVGPGDPVHVALSNSPAFMALWLATSHIGAWIVPADPECSSREFREQIDRTRPVLGVCGSRAVANYRQSVPSTLPFLVVDESDTSLDVLVAKHPPYDWRVRPTSRAAVLFTSGTTGAPKGVIVTQANFGWAGHAMALASGLTADSRQLVVLPLCHANAQYYSVASAISVGASVVLIGRFSASRFLYQAARHDATHASLFAAPIRMILHANKVRSGPISLENVWFAQNLTEGEYAEASELFGCRPRQLYGMTETMPAVLTSPRDGTVFDSIGTPTIGCEVSLRDDEWQLPAVGHVGQIVVRGVPGRTLFDGYLDDDHATRSAFRGDWFLTGDFASQDIHGNYYFAGRHDELLKVAGESVSLVEIEMVLRQHPGIEDVAVVGVPDPIRDEVPVAYVVSAERNGISRAELEDYCLRRLSPAKRPRRFELVRELPRTSVGKIRKSVLRASEAVPVGGEGD